MWQNQYKQRQEEATKFVTGILYNTELLKHDMQRLGLGNMRLKRQAVDQS